MKNFKFKNFKKIEKIEKHNNIVKKHENKRKIREK